MRTSLVGAGGCDDLLANSGTILGLGTSSTLLLPVRPEQRRTPDRHSALILSAQVVIKQLLELLV
jgi:hypothetical protein